MRGANVRFGFRDGILLSGASAPQKQPPPQSALPARAPAFCCRPAARRREWRRISSRCSANWADSLRLQRLPCRDSRRKYDRPKPASITRLAHAARQHQPEIAQRILSAAERQHAQTEPDERQKRRIDDEIVLRVKPEHIDRQQAATPCCVKRASLPAAADDTKAPSSRRTSARRTCETAPR